jgi:hypothetical protein
MLVRSHWKVPPLLESVQSTCKKTVGFYPTVFLGTSQDFYKYPLQGVKWSLIVSRT